MDTSIHMYMFQPRAPGATEVAPPPGVGSRWSSRDYNDYLRRIYPATTYLPDTRGQPGWNTSTSRGIYIYILVDACTYRCTQVMLDHVGSMSQLLLVIFEWFRCREPNGGNVWNTTCEIVILEIPSVWVRKAIINQLYLVITLSSRPVYLLLALSQEVVA